MLGSHLRDVLPEVIERLLQPFHRSILLGHFLPQLGGLEQHLHADARLLTFRLEDHRGVKKRTADVVIDDALRRDHLAIDDVVLVIGAVGAVHDEDPFAAGTNIHRLRGGGKSVRTPPLRDVFRRGPGVEYEIPRGVENARRGDLTRGGVRATSFECGVHASSPSSFSIRADIRPAGRSSAPRNGGSDRATRTPL